MSVHPCADRVSFGNIFEIHATPSTRFRPRLAGGLRQGRSGEWVNIELTCKLRLVTAHPVTLPVVSFRPVVPVG